MKDIFNEMLQSQSVEVKDGTIEQGLNYERFILKDNSNVSDSSNLSAYNIPLITNCNGQYFSQNCIKCRLLLKIWCTEWQACPKCGTKNYGKHYGA